ncbi:unnamed protein product [Ascophyllum nodosum]
MREAGYRDTVGNWLARPSRPLEKFDEIGGVLSSGQGGTGRRARANGSGASVLFVRESKLMEALRSTLSGNAEIIEATVEGLRWEEGRGGGSGVAAHLSPPSPKPSASTLEGVGSEFKPGFRWTGAFDLVVGADGADSFVRRVTVGGGGDDGDATPERRGYVVYRGVCAGSAVGCEGREGGAQEQWGSESFQTWGPGLRFASVPLAGDERMWFATVADGVFPAGNTPPAVSIKPFLLETFGAWHEPISNLLRSTRDEDILCEDARAMSARGLRLVASSRYADSPSVERGERGQQWRSSVVLVGDAAHMLDPVLAQGAGVALEDAFLLARYLKDYNDSLEHSLGASKMSTGVKGAGIETVLARYDEERLRRVLLLSRLSDLSQSLGHLRPPGLARLRNSLASLAPSVARSLIFDCFMATSLAGGSRGAVRAAAAAIGWGRGDARFGGFRIPDL